jgi:hypothetical protein
MEEFNKLTVQTDFDDDEPARSGPQLIPLALPAHYDDAKSKSEILAAVSTVTKARNCLTHEQLEADLPYMTSQAQTLGQVVLKSIDVRKVPDNVYERESRLRYWLVSTDGRQLFSEWIKFFMLCPDYLAMAPLDVQETMEGLHAAPAIVQVRALLVTFSTAVMTNPGKNKRLREPEDEHFEKRARLNPNTAQSNKPRGIYRKVDVVSGRKEVRWSCSRLNAWTEIQNVPLSDLPDVAFSEDEHELESHCTPAAADIRLCKWPVSMEKRLTVSSSPG